LEQVDRLLWTEVDQWNSADNPGPESDGENQPSIKRTKKPFAKTQSNSGQKGKSKLKKSLYQIH